METKKIKKISLNLVQSGTALGRDNSTRMVRYLVVPKDIESEPYLYRWDEIDDIDYDYESGYDIACKVVITYPRVLWGTWGEFMRDASRAAVRKAVEEGILEEHEEDWLGVYYTVKK
jgi:hypothetical protein